MAEEEVLNDGMDMLNNMFIPTLEPLMARGEIRRAEKRGTSQESSDAGLDPRQRFGDKNGSGAQAETEISGSEQYTPTSGNSLTSSSPETVEDSFAERLRRGREGGDRFLSGELDEDDGHEKLVFSPPRRARKTSLR